MSFINVTYVDFDVEYSPLGVLREVTLAKQRIVVLGRKIYTTESLLAFSKKQLENILSIRMGLFGSIKIVKVDAPRDDKNLLTLNQDAIAITTYFIPFDLGSTIFNGAMIRDIDFSDLKYRKYISDFLIDNDI